jgi:hypothetical protein
MLLPYNLFFQASNRLQSHKWPISERAIRETIIDHREEYTRFKEQNVTYRDEAVDLSKRHAALCVSVPPTNLKFLPAVPFTELLSKQKATVNGHRKSISEVYENLENIQESEQGMECTQQCIIICEEALRKAVNDDAEDFEFVSPEDQKHSWQG